jgi:hypothetical protein
MNQAKFEPMEKFNFQVYTTKDYSLFKTIDGNRNINLLHLNRLLKSMKEVYLFTCIIVNEFYQIIDGQHRFECCKELKLPLNYVMMKGYGLREVQILNQNSKTWNADDFLEGYCKLGYEHYIEYLKFKTKFEFGHNECMLLLGGSDNGHNIKEFYAGNFKIKDYNLAHDKAQKICMIGRYYDGYKRSSFVRTMNNILAKPQFDFTQFMQKLKIQPLALQDCNSIDQYKLLIEEIYNYRNREKINLRY